MTNKEKLNDFLDEILAYQKVQPSLFFQDKRKYGDQEDMMCSFLSFLISRCILRYAPRCMTEGAPYIFSNPGRIIVQDKIKRTAFIEEFLNFYEQN